MLHLAHLLPIYLPMPIFRPRIYCISALHRKASRQNCDTELEQAFNHGFDHVLLDALDGQLSGYLAAAHSLQLGLFVQLNLDAPPPGSALSIAHPEWQLRATYQDLPDPRKTPNAAAANALNFEQPEIAAAILKWWCDELTGLAAKGIGGFCFRLDGPAPASFFQDLIQALKAHNPNLKFLAWTPGVTAERIAALQGCGFDGAFSSSAWWDFRAGWLQEESLRLRPFGTVLALAYPPDTTHAMGQDDSAVALMLRQLWLAAMTGDGMAVPAQLLDAARQAGDHAVDAVKAALLLCRERSAQQGVAPWNVLSAPFAPVAVVRSGRAETGDGDQLVLAANAGPQAVQLDIGGVVSRCDGLALASAIWPLGDAPAAGQLATLGPFEARVYTARRGRAALAPPKDPKKTLEASAKLARIVIEGITPCVDGGRFIAKRSVGDVLTVEADIFGEGHDRLAAVVRWRTADAGEWQETPLTPLPNDRWRCNILLARAGRYQYQIEAWIDAFGAYRNEIDKKAAAGQQVSLELREGRLLLQAALAHAEAQERHQLITGLKRSLKTLDEQVDEAGKVGFLLSDEVLQLMAQADQRSFAVRSTPVLQVDAERRAAGFSSWYELFPRSMGKDAQTHGKFSDVMARLPAIRDMGFDTLYFTPIHPIGRKHRKGRNNALDAGPDDPGSPYAIGSEDGGHDAIHPELGTLDDFRQLRSAAKQHGLELALDFAIQCAPDHPWLKAHPDWFTWRPDGSIRYAENPPKKYQDIVNVDFYAKGSVPSLWLALRDVVLFWVREGVHVFRVDNPHTKPMPFWEWLIADVRSRYSDVVFLAEAFTRPKPMYQLAKLGFSQSYTYFTWRHTKQEFTEYLTELADGPPRDFFRPHFFVNTPDINPVFLQRSGRAGFIIRAALAAMLSGLWGIYSGFELCEAAPVPGKEEYLDSEKYELRHRDWNQPGNIVAEITLLNRLRMANPALQSHLGVQFCRSSGDAILCFTKTAVLPAGGGSNVLFIAICLDPHAAHDCTVELPLNAWGLEDSAPLVFEDLVNGTTLTLQGRRQEIRLDPGQLPFVVWRLRPEGAI